MDAHEQEPGDRQHDEGDDEQNEAQDDQRGGVEIADRLGELVGDGRGDGVAGRQHGGGDVVGIADDEGDRHGLAERAAEPEHDAADDADAGVGQHHVRTTSQVVRPAP